jgi:hypothetical protein
MNQTPAPAQLTFVSNLFTSKIFLAQLAAVIASIATAAGVHVLDDPGNQQMLIVLLGGLATMLLRWLFPTGPVSISAPISTPAAQDVPVGASVVHVAAPADKIQVTAVQPLAMGDTMVTVLRPEPAKETPAVVVEPARSNP